MTCRTFYFITQTFKAIEKKVQYSTFKSSLALDKLYPNSVNIKPFEPPNNADGKFTGYIPIKDLQITSSRSGAPGGQNVNKTETKIDVRFHVDSVNWLSESTKFKLKEKYYTRINKDGYFIIRSEKTRSKILNTADALRFLREIIFKLEKPDPVPSTENLEKWRKNKEKAIRRRLMEKRSHSLIKNARRGEID